jgi:crossover junction endodeoxyribonuclease RusA
VVIHFSDRRKQDLSNRIKVLEDALVQAGLMDDDSQINEIVVKRGEIIKGGLCLVKIVALEQN